MIVVACGSSSSTSPAADSWARSPHDCVDLASGDRGEVALVVAWPARGVAHAGQTVGEAENHERRQVEQWCGLADGEAAVYDQQSEQLRKLGVGRYLGCIAY